MVREDSIVTLSIHRGPIIDFIIAVRERSVDVKFLVNDHASRVDLMKGQLSNLQLELFPNVEVRLFNVCTSSRIHKIILLCSLLFQSQFDVHGFHGTHTKFMVTDTSLFIGIIIQ